MAIIDVLGVPHAYDLTAPTPVTETLVFIHGWLLSRGYWKPVIERLASDYQCLAYDLRGFGESRALPQPKRWDQVTEISVSAEARNLERYTPAAYAQDLGVLLEQLGIERAWLIGHSLGGAIALWSALQFSDRIQGVICINSGGGIYLQEEFERFRAAGQQLVKRRPQWLCYLPFLDLLFTRANVARPIDRIWGRQRLIDFVVAHPEAALGTLLDSTTEAEVHRLPQIVSKLEQPVYFVAGQKDTVMDVKYVRHLASFHHLFKDGQENVIEIPDCGHLSMVECPHIVEEKIRLILGTDN